MFEETDIESAYSRLEEPIPMEKILMGNPSFTVRTNDEDKEEDTDITRVFDYDALQPYCLRDSLEPPNDNEENLDDKDVSKLFSDLRKRMTDISKDGKIKKQIEKHGSGEMIPNDKQIWYAFVHYSVYVEMGEFPFDCSNLRSKKPVRWLIGDNQTLEGLEIAVRSMHVGEKSKFLIHPDLAFRDKGVPPRIPPQATVLLDVELFDFYRASKIDDNPTPKTFDDIIKEARIFCDRGNTIMKNEKNYNNAIISYRKGVNLLLLANYANNEEEENAKHHLLRLYSNLAVCYMKKKEWKRVCIAFNDVNHDCPGSAFTNAKLLFTSAKALRFLGDFKEATRRLDIASKLQPGNAEILEEMKTLENTREKKRKEEVDSCRRMFGFMKIDKSVTDNDTLRIALCSVSNEFKEEFNDILETFMESDKKSEELRGNFSNAEVDYMIITAKRKKLEVRKQEKCTEWHITFIKHAL